MIDNIGKVYVRNLEKIFKRRKNFYNLSLSNRRLNKILRKRTDKKESREISVSLLLSVY
jgi:hypothetical protein